MCSKNHPSVKIPASIFFLFTTVIACHSSHKQKEILVNNEEAISYQFTQKPSLSPAENQLLLKSIHQWYDSFISTSNINGAVLVAKNGHIIFEKYKGTNPLKSNTPINQHTVFHIASVTKTFTAMAILQLQEQGKLSIEEPFQKYFPAFNYPGVTIKTLLNHRSGLPNYLYFMERLWPDKHKFITNQNVLEYLINHKSSLTNIGAADKNFSYCNTNYALLALLIEKISGQPYPVYLKEQIFKPLQMNDSFVFTEADSVNITPNYDYKGNVIPLNYLDLVYGDKNIYSTVRDLLQWNEILTSGNFLKAESLQLAYTPYSNEHPGIKNYGLGWRMDLFPNGKKLIFHNGWWHGNNASFMRLIDEDVCIIALNNYYSRAIYKTKYLVNSFGNYFDSPSATIDVDSLTE